MMNQVFIHRQISEKVLDYSGIMPVITITGPRQSGKTTLVKHLFPEYDYYNFELPLTRNEFYENPINFLKKSGKGIIIDEFQHINDLLSYIQVLSDEDEKPGRFILTGSQNYTMLNRISQSLAGRTALFSLLPFSLSEFADTSFIQNDYHENIVRGFYPRTVLGQIPHQKWFEDYINLYLERDVKSILNIKDIAAYSVFLRLCASRCGQILNLTDLARQVGRDVKTIKSWISVLEISNIVFLVQPFYQNFNKRIIKSPKLYFYDSGLACALLNISSASELENHQLKGNLFENFIVSEVLKNISNGNQKIKLYFWNDRGSKEIDLLLEYGNSFKLIEIKSSKESNISFASYMNEFKKLSNLSIDGSFVVFTGENEQKDDVKFVNWSSLSNIL